jgi:hypothetical protein
MKTKNRLIRIIGFAILTVSCILFILIPVVPFFDIPAAQIAAITTGLLIAGEILFYLSLFVLGRGFFDKIKSKIKFWKSKTGSEGLPAEPSH